MICSLSVLTRIDRPIYCKEQTTFPLNLIPNPRRKEIFHGTTTCAKQPIETLRDRRLKATLWENQGESGSYHTVSLAKVYENKQGTLQETHSFSAGELLRVAELARESHGLIRDLRRDQSHDRKADSAPERDDRPRRFRGASTAPKVER